MNFWQNHIKHFLKIVLALLVFSIQQFSSSILFAQGPCDPGTPVFNVNLTGNPNGTWVSPAVPRLGNCCGTSAPYRCIEFVITLDPTAIAINFQITSGAIPSGAMFYQIGCGTPTPVGTAICLNGPGPYTLTFCKPGNNINTYSITSIGKPSVSPIDTVGFGCYTTMYASGLLVNSSLQWTSIYPGAPGAYNSYLSCTSSCLSTTVTSQTGVPPYVDYQVSGMPIGSSCLPPGLFYDTTRIYFSPPLASTINPNPASFCANSNSGVLLTGSGSGGVPPYTYEWTDSSDNVIGTGLSYTALTAGNYSFIVYDRNYPDCSPAVSSVAVTIDPAPMINAGPDQIICDTSVTLNAAVIGATGGIWTGGNGVFTPGDTSANAAYTPTIAERTNGTLILTYTSTGNGGCSAVSDQVVISFPPPVNLSISGTPVICYGQTTTITANVTGGVPPYSYQWNTGETTQSISSVAPGGTYIVTVTDASPGACTKTDSMTFVENQQIIIITSLDSTIACNTTAFISASATGGTGILTYLWSNGATTTTTTVHTGTYTITVTDSSGCSSSSPIIISPSNSTLSVTINQPSILCNGSTTTLTATHSGGSGSYSYSWNTSATTQSIIAGAGNYCATVTDGAGCIATACAILTESPALSISIPTPSLICNGGVGTVNANASGGQPPYSYHWNTGETSQSITKTAGTYTVTVSDAANCTKTASVSISQEAVISNIVNHVNVACFGENSGSATATVSGGIAPYLFSWSPFGGSSATANGLPAGTYTVTVTDNIGCSKIASTTITQPPSALTAAISVLNEVSCNGGTNGAAIVNATGGTTPYLYAWNPGGGTGQSSINLSAGSYTVTITDAKGCTQTVQTSITEPSPLTANIIFITSVSCNGGNTGSAKVTASGGSPGYTYSWAPSGGTTPTAYNLTAGTYIVTIKDSKNCLKPVTIVINQPPVLSSTINGNNISCNGDSNGTATITPSGGTSPYHYAWNTSPIQTTATAADLNIGTYTVTITDTKGCTTTNHFTISQPPILTVTTSPSTSVLCNATATISALANGGTGNSAYLWSTGETTTSINVHIGKYKITVTDSAGCTAIDSVSVGASNSALTENINQPPNLCHGATTTITATASNGAGTYTYLWNNGLTTSSITVGAGSYCCTVTDGAGCVASACVTVNQNNSIGVTIHAAPLICSGATDTIAAVGSGGQTPYTYLWSSGEHTQFILKPAGTYYVVLSDVTGSNCSASDTITVTEAAPINTTMSHTNISCFGANNGSALVYATGGMPVDIYSWAPSGDTSAYAANLSPGLNTVTVTDTMGCIKTGNVTITQPAAAVTITISTTNNLCFSDSIGTATATGSGGVSPYYYFWAVNGDTLSTITGLQGGIYNVVVADNAGCYTNLFATISQPTNINISDTTIASTCSHNNGSATIVANGGTGAYTYSWNTSPVQTTPTASNLLAGNYTVTVKDSNNCSRPFAITIDAATSLNANFNSTPECLNSQTLFTDSTTYSSGSSITSWAWDFGNFNPINHTQNPTFTYTVPGVYTVSLTVTSSIGCVSTITKPVSFYYLPSANFSDTIACQNSFTQFTDSSTVSAGNISSWLWNFGDASPTMNTQNPGHTYNSASVYNVSLVVTTNHGCSSSIVKPITIYPNPIAQFTVSDTSGCMPLCTIFTDASLPVSGTITNWLWNFGDGTPTGTNSSAEHCYTVAGSNTISLTVTTSHGCTSTKTKANLINIYPLPIAAFTYSPQPANSDAPEISFNNLSVGATSWSWNFGEKNDTTISTLQFPTHRYSDSGYFCPKLIVQNIHSCFDTVVHCLEINAEFTFYIPNAFTPDASEGINDKFSGYGTFIKQYAMSIYDRWGNLIFYTDDLGIGWDGKANHGTEIAQQDVYVYSIELKDFNGHIHRYRGIVTLIR